jgi:hypothetical protein
MGWFDDEELLVTTIYLDKKGKNNISKRFRFVKAFLCACIHARRIFQPLVYSRGAGAFIK